MSACEWNIKYPSVEDNKICVSLHDAGRLVTLPVSHLHQLLGCCQSLQSLGVGIAQLVVCWARCPAWCSVMGLILLWGEFFW